VPWRRPSMRCAQERLSPYAASADTTCYAMPAVKRAVLRLRQRKGRPAKPLAVMIPWAGEDWLGPGEDWLRNSVQLESAALLGADPGLLSFLHEKAAFDPEFALRLARSARHRRDAALQPAASSCCSKISVPGGGDLRQCYGVSPCFTEPDEAQGAAWASSRTAFSITIDR
jgi:hypothetical protein